MRYGAYKHFWLKLGSLSPTVTLKIRSRSSKPKQLFIMSQCYIHANLVKIHPPVHEISCKQESVMPMLTLTLTPMGSAPKNNMFPSPSVGDIKRIGSKTTEKRWQHHFPHYKSMGAFCCHGNQSFDPICPKTLCSLSPTPMMLHKKFDQDWPTCFKDIQVQKCKIHNEWSDSAQNQTRPSFYACPGYQQL